ncbi:hypothetical protein [uncultured Algibacter sp.]|uniref:hypothetical protein n=1 Tax=uncultured Algibacter sp. TaxID=298659 RepID=UPI0026168BB6|nr:hypothetical protein [uncultured Algibacter sp.]
MFKKAFLLSLLAICNFHAQNGLSFSSNKKIYIKGHSTLIGNNIVSTHSTKTYKGSSFNDVLNLKYIDVDKNKNTFSSSQATLTIDLKKPKIAYAALYWSAIYRYDKGRTITKNLTGHNKNIKQMFYEGDEVRSTDVNNVLFKTPNNEYRTIKGNIIYDSFNREHAFPETKPYVCYADVTSILQNLKQINGDYTVANIKATQGMLSGGAAGGWLLYVIYEDEHTTPKYFTAYNGFINVFKKPVDIVFEDFKAPEIGQIKTALLLGALEGDKKFKTDFCSFLDYKSETYIPLFNKLRPRLNFFNGSITINDNLYSNRLPNNENTLGFDLLKIQIPNSDNSIISNNMRHAQVSFNSKADQFYLFFVAFETEINPIFLESKTNTESILVIEKNKIPVIDQDLEKIKNLTPISIPSIEKGYYLVTNVFSSKSNALKWMANLKEKGFDTKSYINPENNWTYVYLDRDEDPVLIYERQNELSKLDYFEDIWILKINF